MKIILSLNDLIINSSIDLDDNFIVMMMMIVIMMIVVSRMMITMNLIYKYFLYYIEIEERMQERGKEYHGMLRMGCQTYTQCIPILIPHLENIRIKSVSAGHAHVM